MNLQTLWPDLSREVQQLLQSESQILNFKRGNSIYSQGDRPKGLYVVQSGLVGLTIVSASSGKEHLLRFFREKEFFGHRALFSEEEYHGSAVALELTDILFISRSIVLAAIEKDKSLLRYVVHTLARELRQAENQRVMILENEIKVRVAQALIYLKDLHPDHNWTRLEIANFCASTTSTVIKALAELEAEGYISQQGRVIVVQNRAGLIELQDQ